MKNSLKLIILDGCPYSIALKQLLKDTISLKLVQVITISYENKEKYKTKEISTFPQLYLINNNIKSLIGGYDMTKSIIDEINKNNNLNKLKLKLKEILPKFTTKQILRVIQIFKII
jgi:glutaredoxin